MEIEAHAGEEQSSKMIDNHLKAHCLEKEALIKVLKMMFALEQLFLLKLKLEPLEKMRKKVEEDEKDEMRNEEGWKFMYSSKESEGGMIVCMKKVWKVVLSQLLFL